MGTRNKVGDFLVSEASTERLLKPRPNEPPLVYRVEIIGRVGDSVFLSGLDFPVSVQEDQVAVRVTFS